MATILKLGTLLLDGAATNPGTEYQPGQTIGFGEGQTLQWVIVNGLLIADRPLLLNISWDDLNRQDLIFGKPMTINGQQFLCRLLKVGAEKNTPNEWDLALDVTGEDDSIWHWKRVFFWGQEHLPSSYRARRGYRSARNWNWSDASIRNATLGFRPVLEPQTSESLTSGTRVCAVGGQSILYGRLLETTTYDVILKPENRSKSAKADDGKLYTRLPDGMVAIDRSQMVIQR